MLRHVRSSLRVLSLTALVTTISSAFVPVVQAYDGPVALTQDGPAKYVEQQRAKINAQRKLIAAQIEKIEKIEDQLAEAVREAGTANSVGLPLYFVDVILAGGVTVKGIIQYKSNVPGVAKMSPKTILTVAVVGVLIAAGTVAWVKVEQQEVERLREEFRAQTDKLQKQKQVLADQEAQLDLQYPRR